MRARSSLFYAWLAAACAVAFTAIASAQAVVPQRRVNRDWTKCPAIVEIADADNVYAVGDVHGDYDRLVALLSSAKVIAARPDRPENPRWVAGNGVLVCTGDLIDKWHDSLKVIAIMRALSDEATKAGGRVVVTMGNHEAEFLADAESQKSAEFREDLARHGIDFRKVAEGRDPQGIGNYLRSLPFAARIGDWFFVHAGNTHERTIRQLAADLRKGVDSRGFGSPVLLDGNSLLEARLHPLPWWEVELDKAHPHDSRIRLKKSVDALGAKHVVVGHQPSSVQFSDGGSRKKGEICQKFDGLVFLIDCGMSRGIGSAAIGYSTGAILHIGRDSATAVFADGSFKLLWMRR
jgi:hypothetical protein